MVILRICACLLWLLAVGPALAQDPPQCPMQTYNLEVVQAIINVMGYEALATEGFIIGPQEDANRGTALCIAYAVDKDNDWYKFTIKIKDGKITKFKGASSKPPGEK